MMTTRTPAARVGRLARLSLLVAGLAVPIAAADITYSLTGDWPADKRAAAEAAIGAAVARYNAHGGFDKNLNIQFNWGVATADGNYNGTIRFGPNISINERVSLHEILHTLGVGTTGNYAGQMTGGTWDGPIASALIEQFDGIGATLRGDGVHFWPYGLNYDSEGSEINRARSVAMMYAMQADMGLGPASNPSPARFVSLLGDDPLGTSGFNYASNWSNGHFPHAVARYRTDGYGLRTPASDRSFRFAGGVLTLDATDGTGGLWYKGVGRTSVITVPTLVLDGGWIDHLAGINDVLRLDGSILVASPSTIRAKQGNIELIGPVIGDAPLTIAATDAPDQDLRYVRMRSDDSTFTGDLNVLGRFELADGANFRFAVAAPGVSNTIAGPSAWRVAFNGMFEIDLSAASTEPGSSWTLVDAQNVVYGSTFSIEGFTEAGDVWTHPDGYIFTEATGLLELPDVDPACSAADIAEPFGTLDLFDVLAYFDAVSSGDLGAADLNTDGVIDLFDILGYFELFGQGC